MPRSLACLAAAAALLAASVALAQLPPASPARHLAEARLAAIADGDLSTAIPLYQALVDSASGSVRVEAAIELGEALAALGRQEEARAAFQTALATDPLSSRAAGQYARLGGLLGVAGDLISRTGPAATGSDRLAPAQGWEALLPPADRAGFRAQVDRYARERAARALFAAGKRMWVQRDRERAAAVLGQVVTQFPAELGAADLQDVGETALGGGQARLAADAFRAALELTSRGEGGRHTGPIGQQAWLRFRMGEALMQAGEMAEARVAFGDIMKLGPGIKAPNGRALAIPAEIHFRESRALRTWQDLRTAADLFQAAQEAQYTRHVPDEAAALYRRVATEFPDSNFDGRSLAQLAAIAWFERQDGRTALELIDQIVGSDRKDDLWPNGVRAGAWALFNQGRIREAAGDRAGARTSYRQLLDDWPDTQDHDGKPFASRAVQRLSLLGGLP